MWVVHGSHDRTGIAGLDGFKVLTVGELEVAVISTFPDPEPASLGPRFSGPRLQRPGPIEVHCPVVVHDRLLQSEVSLKFSTMSDALLTSNRWAMGDNIREVSTTQL